MLSALFLESSPDGLGVLVLDLEEVRRVPNRQVLVLGHQVDQGRSLLVAHLEVGSYILLIFSVVHDQTVR